MLSFIQKMPFRCSGHMGLVPVPSILRVALLVQRCLSNAASFVLCACRSVKDPHNLQMYSPDLKDTLVDKLC